MPLLISYQDKPDLIVYANLFSSTDKLKAFDVSLSNFNSITLATQSDFAIYLTESTERKGYYSFEISDVSNIPATSSDDFYLVEVFRQQGAAPNRETDRLAGTMVFYWDGQREVDICGCQTDSQASFTPQDVWEYPDRTLTQDIDCGDPYQSTGPCPDVIVDLECPDPYIIVDSSCDQIDELRQQIANSDVKLDQVISLIQNLQIPTGTPITAPPNVTNPTVGPRGSSSGSSSIRVSR